MIERLETAVAGTGRLSPAVCEAGWRSSRWAAIDPLDEDGPGDRAVVTTERQLVRLVVAATEAGGRFARDRSPIDPAAWMLAPRRMFGGRPAIEACREVEGFGRAVLMHGLALGLDAAPEDLDELLLDDGRLDS